MSQFETGISDDHRNEASETRDARNMDDLRVQKVKRGAPLKRSFSEHSFD